MIRALNRVLEAVRQSNWSHVPVSERRAAVLVRDFLKSSPSLHPTLRVEIAKSKDAAEAQAILTGTTVGQGRAASPLQVGPAEFAASAYRSCELRSPGTGTRLEVARTGPQTVAGMSRTEAPTAGVHPTLSGSGGIGERLGWVFPAARKHSIALALSASSKWVHAIALARD